MITIQLSRFGVLGGGLPVLPVTRLNLVLRKSRVEIRMVLLGHVVPLLQLPFPLGIVLGVAGVGALDLGIAVVIERRIAVWVDVRAHVLAHYCLGRVLLVNILVREHLVRRVIVVVVFAAFTFVSHIRDVGNASSMDLYIVGSDAQVAVELVTHIDHGSEI